MARMLWYKEHKGLCRDGTFEEPQWEIWLEREINYMGLHATDVTTCLTELSMWHLFNQYLHEHILLKH